MYIYIYYSWLENCAHLLMCQATVLDSSLAQALVIDTDFNNRFLCLKRTWMRSLEHALPKAERLGRKLHSMCPNQPSWLKLGRLEPPRNCFRTGTWQICQYANGQFWIHGRT